MNEETDEQRLTRINAIYLRGYGNAIKDAVRVIETLTEDGKSPSRETYAAAVKLLLHNGPR